LSFFFITFSPWEISFAGKITSTPFFIPGKFSTRASKQQKNIGQKNKDGRGAPAYSIFLPDIFLLLALNNSRKVLRLYKVLCLAMQLKSNSVAAEKIFARFARKG
jgi:hypothetical protein